MSQEQPAKRIALSTTSERSKVKLNVMIERYIRSSDNRDGVIKYFHKYKEKAMAAVSDELFIAKSGYSSEQGIQIELSTFLPDTLDLDYIDSLANNIAEVRRLLDN